MSQCFRSLCAQLGWMRAFWFGLVASCARPGLGSHAEQPAELCPGAGPAWSLRRKRSVSDEAFRWVAFGAGLLAFGAAAVPAVAQVAPTIMTPTQSGVSSVAATVGGNVTSDGGSAVTARGVVVAPAGTNPDPRLGGASVTDLPGTGTTGAFTVSASALAPNTYYAFRAYATNAGGTSYTDVATFRTALESVTGFTGGTTAVANFQPTAAMTWMICVAGIFPSRGGEGPADDGGYIGEIRLMPVDIAVSHWVKCEGQIVNIASNTALFSLIGTIYGGNGMMTFQLPDLRGRVPVGFGQGPGLSRYEIGEPVGSESTQLLAANLPTHAHESNEGVIGSGTGFENRQPSLPVNICLQTTGDSNMIGAIRIFAFDFQPGGFEICNGTMLDIGSNAALFSKIGNAFGGDGMTTFALPDLRGRTPVGVGIWTPPEVWAPRALAQTGGTEKVTLSTAQMPAHTHSHAGGETGSIGGVVPHATVQPYLALHAAIAVVASADGSPEVGEVRFWATNSFGDGWLACNGAELDRTTYSAAFAVLGSTYGGDGATTFRVPDSQARAIMSAGTSSAGTVWTVGQMVGSDEVTLSIANMPSHQHTVTVAPVVSTVMPTNVIGEGATLGGNVEATGGATVTERGVVWATSVNPTTANNKVPIGSGTGTFSQAITGLPSSSTVYVRAYATNSTGTSYGLSLSFTTQAPNNPPTGIALTAASVLQSAGANATVGTLAADDADSGDTHTFAFVAGDGDANNGAFALASGVLKVGSTPLSPGSYSVRIRTTDAAGAAFARSFALTVVDDVVPTVASVSVPANATYVSGQNLDFTVNFSEAVTVNTGSGIPAIAVTIGSTSRSATYQSGSGTSALVFRYTTQAGDLDSDGVTVGALSANGGTLQDAAGNSATLTLASVGATTAVLVDAVAPTVTGRTVPADGTYKAGQDLDFTVTYSENVTVVGTPYVAVTLATGGSVQAAYNGGTGTATLTFRYTVASGNLDADGIAAASAITLNGGTIKDGTGNDAAITSLGFAATTGVLVDGVAPTVLSIMRQTPSSESTNATSVTYRVTFSEAVTGVDTADFTLTKTGTANGTIASVSAVSSTVYDVTVNTIGGAGTLRLDLKATGTGIADTATNAIATGYTSGETYTIDMAAPTLSTIARQTPTTVHTDAASATWRVTFAEGVTGVDATDFTATAVSGTGSGTVALVTPVSATVYDVAVNLSGQARLRLDLKSTGTGIADLAGNALADGGFANGDFYLTGVTSVFESLNLTLASNVTSSLASTNKPAQRFTTAAGQPLTLSSVVAKLNAVTPTPAPVVRIYTDNLGAPGTAVGTALTNPASLTASALNVWTGSVTLSASTTYWIVFEETTSAYEIGASTQTTGGTGDWLTYLFRYGTNSGTMQTGALQLALGATSTPAISSSLTASGTAGLAFSYQMAATNTPTSYAATGLPTGLSLNTSTGAITGTPTRAGTFNVTLTATNGSGTGPSSTLVLTLAKGTATVTLGSLSQTYNSLPRSATAATTPSGLSVSFLYNGSTTAPTAVGSYNVTATINDADYDGSNAGTLTIGAAATTVSLGNLLHTYDGTAKSATASTSPTGLTVTITYDGSTTAPTAAGSYAVVATVTTSGYTGRATGTLTIQPAVTVPPVVTPGSATTISAADSGLGHSGHWQRNGADLTNATGLTLTLPSVQPPVAGLYTYTATAPGGGIASSEPVIVGLTTTEEVVGTAIQVGEDIRHPNGNVYDQVQLQGTGAAVTAEPSRTTRISYIDLNGDIVQVELSGAGTLSLIVDDAGTPAPAQNYNQAGVNYVQGHAGIVITGADATTNVSVFTVGRMTAVNQSLFKDTVSYDGVADLAFIAIQSKDGKFGGIRTGNVNYFATQGFTGIYAPGVEVTGPINIGDINAHDSAQAVLVTGSAANAKICGGNLEQANGRPVQTSGLGEVQFAVGTTSHGGVLPAQANAGKLVEDGADVTTELVVPPKG